MKLSDGINSDKTSLHVNDHAENENKQSGQQGIDSKPKRTGPRPRKKNHGQSFQKIEMPPAKKTDDKKENG